MEMGILRFLICFLEYREMEKDIRKKEWGREQILD